MTSIEDQVAQLRTDVDDLQDASGTYAVASTVDDIDTRFTWNMAAGVF